MGLSEGSIHVKGQLRNLSELYVTLRRVSIYLANQVGTVGFDVAMPPFTSIDLPEQFPGIKVDRLGKFSAEVVTKEQVSDLVVRVGTSAQYQVANREVTLSPNFVQGSMRQLIEHSMQPPQQ